MADTTVTEAGPWSRRRWIKQFMLGTATTLGVTAGWRGRQLADISPDTPPSDIIPLSLSAFPGLLDGSTPSIQLQLSLFEEIIMINRAPYSGEIFVLDSRCTHQGCPVNKWDVNAGIVCPCHGSVYNIDGLLVHGVAGSFQPPLNSYQFTYDGTDKLKIQWPGLNLKINDIAVETTAPASQRLRLSFPAWPGADYRVRYSRDLTAPSQPVLFATTASGQANQTTVTGQTSGPLNLWVDSAAPRGFFQIELVLNPY